MAGADEGAVRQAEEALGYPFPADYRAFMLEQDGTEGWFGDVYLMLFPIGVLADLHRAHNDAEHMPGFGTRRQPSVLLG